jgi:lipopolysaccharide export LptBFGC system permease protein LptF
MGNIITGYLAREILKTSFATLLVLYVILVSNALGRVLAMPWGGCLRILPMAIFLGRRYGQCC